MNYKKYTHTALALAVLATAACSEHRGPDSDQLESPAGGVGAASEQVIESPADIRTESTPVMATATYKTCSKS